LLLPADRQAISAVQQRVVAGRTGIYRLPLKKERFAKSNLCRILRRSQVDRCQTGGNNEGLQFVIP
jgi:hypothetical protein